MTIEEVIKTAKGLRTDFKCESDTMVDFCNTIIETLEQEPKVETKDLLTKPKERIGHWIANKAKYYPGWIHCSECGEDWTHDGRPPYCPACGARMIEEG